MTNLTKREEALLKYFPTFDFIDGREIEAGLQTWSFAITDNAVAFGTTPKGASGVLSSLAKKGLVVNGVTDGEHFTELTAEGADVVRSMQDPARAAVLIPAGEMQVGDRIGGHDVAELKQGRVRTWAWDADHKELVYLLNTVRVEVER